ncbi:MAG: DNRLRE domain-containing protein, partial [Chloroflexi bacterium]
MVTIWISGWLIEFPEFHRHSSEHNCIFKTKYAVQGVSTKNSPNFERLEKTPMPTKPRFTLLTSALVLLAVMLFSSLPGRAAQAQTNSLTFTPIADSYIYEPYPSNNYGSLTSLRVTGSPVRRSYLRFTVSGLNGAAIQSARLRLLATIDNSAGITAAALADNTWAESGLTYSNAPAPGAAIASSGPLVNGQWVELDLSSYIKTEGTYNLTLATTVNLNLTMASRESGANAPQLVIVTAGAVPTFAATATLSATPQPTATRPAPTPTTAAGLTRVNLTKGPQLVYTGSSTAMKIFWQWSSNTSFRVDWGATSAYGSSSGTVSAFDTTNRLYSYTITGLAPGTKYYYRVVTGKSYASGTFFTAPSASATTLKFLSYGDSRTNTSTHNTVAGKVNELYQADPGYQTLNMMTGDLITTGSSDS